MLNRRVVDIPFSGIRKFFDVVAKAEDVVSLGVGEPDFPTPEPMKSKALESIRDDLNNYTSNWGLLELREKISEKLKADNGLRYSPDGEILLTSGTSEALDLVFRAILNPGDEVIVPEPSYVSYKPCVWFAQSKPVGVPMPEENCFRFNVEDIEAALTKKTKAIIVASPNNPTGGVLKRSDLKAIADIAVDRGVYVISDELYEDLIYDGERHHSIGSFRGMRDLTVTINGFSKGYAYTGWRLGYAAGPKDILEAMMKIHQYTMLSAPGVAQYGALAFDRCKRDVSEMVRQYDIRRKILVKGLNEVDGVSCIMPKGAFYAFPNIKETGLGSEEFANIMLKDYKVAVVPGNTFGPSGEGYVRCSYACSLDTIREAIERMKAFKP